MPQPSSSPRGLSDARWRELSPFLDRLLDSTAAEQSSLISELGARDAALAADLDSLLDDHRRLQEEGFLEPSLHPPAPATPAGHRVGAYTLRSEIGAGGMGNVWLAERSDGRYQGLVAVKLLNPSRLGHQGEARFQREGTILARLRHPNIAHLVDAGVSPFGQPYLALEYVRGEPIDEYCDRRRLGIEPRLRLFLDVLAAVSFAHSQLVVHRDLKPSNVMVREDGTVKLLDFGIAKLLAEDAGGQVTALTRDGEVMLTPEYASPEQLTGQPVSTGTDVYTLGVLLYVLLSGQHPTAAASSSPAERVRAVVEDEPLRLSLAVTARRLPGPRLAAAAERRGLNPRRWSAALQGDLDNVAAKALKKVPAQRYPSVAALADDLRRHLAHLPVSARPDGLGYRAMKFVRRNRTAVALGVLAAAALAAGLAGTVSQARRATRHAARADEEARQAVAQRDFALLELARTEAVNELNAFLLSDAAPEGKPFTTAELLAKAEEVVRAQQGEAAGIKVELLVQIGELYQYHGDVKKAAVPLAEAYALAAAEPEPSTRARAACALSDMRRQNGDLDGADRLLKEGLAALPDQPQYGVQRAKCLIPASALALQRQDPAAGIALAEEGQRTLRASAMPFVLLELDMSMQVAEAYRYAGRPGEAAAAYEATFAALTRLGRARTERAASVLNNWALALTGLGRSREAEGLLQRAAALGRTGDQDAGVEPTLLCNLARVLRDLERLPEAARLAARARAGAVRLGDEGGVRRALVVEATAARQMNRPELASRLLGQAEALLRLYEDPRHVTFAVVEMERAELALTRGDAKAAAAGADRAVEMAAASGQQLEFVPRLLLRRAQMELALGQPAKAETDARQALDRWHQMFGPGALSGWVGQAQLALAQALHAAGRGAEARAAATEAVRHLEPCLGAQHSQTRAAREILGLPPPA
jgi:eukaryotic-like serine/threonine-protein kinase